VGAGGVSTFTFGEATTADRGRIVAISAITLKEHRDRQPDEFPPGGPDPSLTMFDTYFAGSRVKPGRPADRLIVARKDGLVAGHVLIQFSWRSVDDRTADLTCHIADISIHPDHRGQGLGTRLLSIVREICEEHEATVIGGYVWHGNTASEQTFAKADFRPVTTLYQQRLSRPRLWSPPARAADRPAHDKIDYLPILFIVVLVLVLVYYNR
jgi:GNAT superfamily N-acetyltransferase